MENIDERVRRLVHPKSCSLLLNTFQSAAAGTLKYRCGTNKQERRRTRFDGFGFYQMSNQLYFNSFKFCCSSFLVISARSSKRNHALLQVA